MIKSDYKILEYFLYQLKLYLLYKLLRCIKTCEGKELFFNMQYFSNVLHIINERSVLHICYTWSGE